MRIKTAQWEATYDAEANAYTSRDGTIERFLNGHCKPAQGDEEEAFELVNEQFPALQPQVVEQDEAQPE